MVDSHGADGVRLSTRATMTDGATRCRLLLLEIDDLECHLRFPAYAAHLQAGRPGVGLRFSARGCPDQSSRAIRGLLDKPCCWSNPFATSSCKPSVRQDSGPRQPLRVGLSFFEFKTVALESLGYEQFRIGYCRLSDTVQSDTTIRLTSVFGLFYQRKCKYTYACAGVLLHKIS